MKIIRQPEIVEAYHYELITGEKAVPTEINVGIKPIHLDEEDKEIANTKIESSVLGLRVMFQIALGEFYVAGSVRQLVTVDKKRINRPEDCTQEELDELMGPLFSIIKRLTYEVTEITLDQPGIELNFEANQ